MDDFGLQLTPEWAAVLDTARQRRAELVGALGNQALRMRLEEVGAAFERIGPVRQWPVRWWPVPWRLARWVLLGAVVLACATLIRHDGAPYAAMMLAIALASLASSIAGFAFSAICGALLFHLADDPVRIVQVMMTCSIANQFVMTWDTRRHIEWRNVTLYLAGGAFGLALGVWTLLHADRALYTHALGVFLMGYGAYMLFRRPMQCRVQHPALDVGIGFIGGITGGAAGFPGAPVTIWCGMKGWPKERQRAVFQPYILIMQIAALLTISLARHQSAGGFGFDLRDLLFVPAGLLGTLAGLSIFRRLSDNQFSRLVTLLLIVSGLTYVV